MPNVIGDLASGINLAQISNNHSADINRYLGGYDRTVDSHPYVKGYFYVFFGFPYALFGNINDVGGATTFADSHTSMVYTLSAAEGFTPPGDRQLKTEDVMGQGGVDSSFITGQTLDRNFSIQYRDYWGSPIFRVHRQWTQYLNPYFGGVTSKFTEFAAWEYKGTCMIIQTKPVTKLTGDWNRDDIIKVDYFDGVFPTTDLKSAYDSNITDNTIAKPTVQYRFDGFPLDETNPQTLEKAFKVLTTLGYDQANASPVIYDHLLNTDVQPELFNPNNGNTI